MSKLVLIIDDSRITRRQIARLLNARGYETAEAENGRAGLEMAETLSPGSILLDILMPEMDGIGFLKQAREKGLAVPVIVMSADAQTVDRIKHLKDLGARAVVDKSPQGVGQLVDVLEDILTSL